MSTASRSCRSAPAGEGDAMPEIPLPDPPLSDGIIELRAFSLSDVAHVTAAIQDSRTAGGRRRFPGRTPRRTPGTGSAPTSAIAWPGMVFTSRSPRTARRRSVRSASTACISSRLRGTPRPNESPRRRVSSLSRSSRIRISAQRGRPSRVGNGRDGETGGPGPAVSSVKQVDQVHAFHPAARRLVRLGRCLP